MDEVLPRREMRRAEDRRTHSAHATGFEPAGGRRTLSARLAQRESFVQLELA
jgi:hypothetical protein